MALLPNVFIPEEAEDSSFDPIPAGWYPAEITKSVLKNTKDGEGKFLAFTFKVDEDADEHAGRLIFTNLNIINNSAMAVKIAQSDLKRICSAVGFEGELEDTEDLHDQMMMIKVTVKPETSQWPAKNEIKDFKSLEDYEAMIND